MNLSKSNPYTIWAFIVGIVVLFILSWITIGIWKAVNTPPRKGIDQARDEFIYGCKAAKSSSWAGTSYGVPNAGGDDATKWTCNIPK